METVWIRAQSKHYPIYLGEEILASLKELIANDYSSFFIITDETVAPFYLERVTSEFSELAPVYHAVVPAGEASKSFSVYQSLLDQLLELNLDRKACVVALGGGVIGDLAGFVAATYLRGIGFIQMPTTLLAHDSSVGGKVGINHAKGKNLIGAFYHPDAVIYNTSFLRSLSEREWRSGFSELVKHSLLDSEAFFEELNAAIPTSQDLTSQTVTPFLARGIKVKARIVEADEKETGSRAFLNLGHTLAHALEKVAGYGVLTHGEAVAIGMRFALKLSQEWFQEELPIPTFENWLKALHLPYEVPPHCQEEAILQSMKRDKKRIGNAIRFVLLKKLGEPTLVELPEEFISANLTHFIKSNL